jgi:hypothetical protein
MPFIVDNMHYLQNNFTVHDINKIYKNQLYVPLLRLAAIQRGVTYSAIKAFNELPPCVSRLKNKLSIRNNLLTHISYQSISSFYSYIEDFNQMFSFCISLSLFLASVFVWRQCLKHLMAFLTLVTLKIL